MSTSSFGQPQYETGSDQPQQVVNGVAAQGTDAPVDVLDPNDPRLTSEALDVNTEGDAYAQPAPPPDGKWRAKLKLEKQKDAQGNEHDWLPRVDKKTDGAYCVLHVSASIIDPSGKYDGINVYPRYGGGVSTQLRRDGSTQVQTLLSKLKRPDGQPWIPAGKKLTHREWAELAVKALAGEPEAGVETIWEWSCQACGTEAKKKRDAGQDAEYPSSILGMNKFPRDAKTGTYSPELRCPTNPSHLYSRAFSKLARFLSLAELGQK